MTGEPTVEDDDEHIDEYSEPPERPQLWHEYRLSHSLNVAWLGYEITASQMYALDDAWDVLVVREEWREWVREYYLPEFPFFYLAVRDDLPRRRLRKNQGGVSLQLPAAEVAAAEVRGDLIELYLGVIRDIYARWAAAQGHPPPPALPVSD